MDMKNILQNMDAAAAGKKPSAAGAAKGEMKSILESFYRVNESQKTVEECGGMMPQQMPQEDKGNPVTMNVTLNASGKENVDELIALMKMAGADGAKEVEPSDMPMIHTHDDEMGDMAKMMRIASDTDEEETDENLVVQATGLDPEEDDDDDDDKEVDEAEGEWDNSPDEKYDDHEYLIKDLAGGLNREKKSYPPTNGGDNPMSLEDQIKEELWAALNDKFTTEGRGRGRGKKKMEDIETNEGRGRGKKGRGRGKG